MYTHFTASSLIVTKFVHGLLLDHLSVHGFPQEASPSFADLLAILVGAKRTRRNQCHLAGLDMAPKLFGLWSGSGVWSGGESGVGTWPQVLSTPETRATRYIRGFKASTFDWIQLGPRSQLRTWAWPLGGKLVQ